MGKKREEKRRGDVESYKVKRKDRVSSKVKILPATDPLGLDTHGSPS